MANQNPDATEYATRDIAPFRQPMVTSLGILMGFLLNFLASWAIQDEAEWEAFTTADCVVVSTVFVALALMCAVLYRLLDIRPSAEAAGRAYVGTFRLYMASIILAFMGLGMAILV